MTRFKGEDFMVLSHAHEGDAAGAIRFLVHAHEGEPLVVIRGRDVLAVPTLLAYIDQCNDHGAMGQGQRMADHVNRFVDWQTANAKLTHMPDPLPGTYDRAEPLFNPDSPTGEWPDTKDLT